MSTVTNPAGESDEPSQPIPLHRRRLRPVAPPRQFTPLLGRDAEVANASALLARGDIRLMTLVGPGGIGKTRLALGIAAESAPAFHDQVAWAPVATATTSEAVAGAVAQSIGVMDTGNAPILESLTAALRDARLLLVIDNFEQALDAAPLLSDLLLACPMLTLLVTSRALLRIAGEHPVDVPPLATEPDSRRSATALETASAVQLFVQRAAGVYPAFALATDNVPVVTEICQRLDGLPWPSSWPRPASTICRSLTCATASIAASRS